MYECMYVIEHQHINCNIKSNKTPTARNQTKQHYNDDDDYDVEKIKSKEQQLIVRWP